MRQRGWTGTHLARYNCCPVELFRVEELLDRGDDEQPAWHLEGTCGGKEVVLDVYDEEGCFGHGGMDGGRERNREKENVGRRWSQTQLTPRRGGEIRGWAGASETETRDLDDDVSVRHILLAKQVIHNCSLSLSLSLPWPASTEHRRDKYKEEGNSTSTQRPRRCRQQLLPRRPTRLPSSSLIRACSRRLSCRSSNTPLRNMGLWPIGLPSVPWAA